MPKTGPKSLTNEHKAALERGRAEGRIVRDYLDALRTSKPKRGRRRTPESIEARLASIVEELPSASAIEELLLVQERRDLSAELEALSAPGEDLTALEDQFIEVAKSYSDRKGISYGSWRDVGVAATVLSRAGIKRGQ